MAYLTFESVVDTGSRSVKGKTVREIIDKDKRLIFEMIKKYHLTFADEVLAEANITKIEHTHCINQEEILIPRDKDLDTSKKKLKKDTKDIETILDEITDSFSGSNYNSAKPDTNSQDDSYDTYKEVENDINHAIMPEDPEL